MKKILIVINNLAAGGAERVLIDILKNISKKKYSIDLLLFWKTGVYIENIPNEVNCTYIFKNYDRNSLYNYIQRIMLRFIVKYPRIIYLLKLKNKYDVEVAFLEGQPAIFVSNSPNFISKKIAWIHINMKLLRIKMKENRNRQELAAYNKMNAIFFVSNAVRTLFLEKFPIKKEIRLCTVYNPIDYQRILCQRDKIPDVILDHDYFNIISIGQLEKRKGFDRLIQVALILTSIHKKIRFYIIGSGKEERDLKKKVEQFHLDEYIIFLGFMKNPYAVLKQGDLFFLPSYYEGLPTVLIEACILGIPSLSSNCSGASEIINNKNGFIVSNESDQQFIKEAVAVIKKIISDKSILSFLCDNLKQEKIDLYYEDRVKYIEYLLDSI
jgi:Glycosyltransferase